jgi:hypothetical protein
MTKYEEMCDAAKTARDEFFAYRKRIWGYFGSVINGLQTHCGVPPQQITYLKWNGHQGEARRYEPPSDSPTDHYTLPGAIEYDEVEALPLFGRSVSHC